MAFSTDRSWLSTCRTSSVKTCVRFSVSPSRADFNRRTIRLLNKVFSVKSAANWKTTNRSMNKGCTKQVKHKASSVVGLNEKLRKQIQTFIYTHGIYLFILNRHRCSPFILATDAPQTQVFRNLGSMRSIWWVYNNKFCLKCCDKLPQLSHVYIWSIFWCLLGAIFKWTHPSQFKYQSNV